jgi:UDP:flavonoid glycosyltransferase YjiC (YdhE family)
VTLLVISPDYASHLLPLATLATRWRDAGERVVVATGPSTAGIVADFGLERVDLTLGRGSNPGVIRADEQPRDESTSLRGFFDATRIGMVQTLRYQARERLTDLMWDPVGRGRRVLEIVDRVRPDAIIVDHLAFSARMALQTAGVPYGGVVLGHPSALPVPGEVYGYPPFWPRAFSPAEDDLAELRALCDRVAAGFTGEWNRAARELNGRAADVSDAFATHGGAHGGTVLYNYPAELAETEGRMLPPHAFLGSTRRDEQVAPDILEWIARDEPYVYVSFGSFLSVRDDVLSRVAEAVRRLGVRAAIAMGATPPGALGDVPDGWLVRTHLPQVRLLASAAAAVNHGGNNSVTEALGSGVPLLVLPFSTDQFAGAATVERTRVGVALDPNAATVAEVTDALRGLLGGDDGAGDLDVDRGLLRKIAEGQAARPGPVVAYEVLAGSRSLTSERIASGSPAADR